MVPATLASMAIHCVQAQTRCMNRLSVKTEPLVSTFAIDAIKPNASKRTDRLDASSKRYNIPVSSFSMLVNCFMLAPPLKLVNEEAALAGGDGVAAHLHVRQQAVRVDTEMNVAVLDADLA